MRRKIEDFLTEWKNNPDRLPLIVKGARQIGKTYSILKFGKANYKYFYEINFATNESLRQIFDNGYETDAIIKTLSLMFPNWNFEPGNTLIFFDEIQVCPKGMTALKYFKLDGRFDVICSGSLMGINYNEIALNSVGYKDEYTMYSMDFEEFLWAKGYSDSQINDILNHLITTTPFNTIEMNVYKECFNDYIIVGGMPSIVKTFIQNNHFGGILKMQRNLLSQYEEDITKYATSLDKGKILNIYRNIAFFLAKENKKFQISKISNHARNREYIGAFEWLCNAGIINICYCLSNLELPLSGNYDINKYKVYFGDSGLLIASLDDESQNDLRYNQNFNTYKGAVYESIGSEILNKLGYKLYYYKAERSELKMDFFIRNNDSLIPIEIKAKDGSTISLQNLVKSEKYPNIKFGIKFCDKNIGFKDGIYTFPLFTMFLLKKFINKL